ncbi:MAG: hypothetical protein LCH59_06495 [Proteobacteria bacterium]|nr:hypothetical protein [Pseudomonadota bacterium]
MLWIIAIAAIAAILWIASKPKRRKVTKVRNGAGRRVEEIERQIATLEAQIASAEAEAIQDEPGGFPPDEPAEFFSQGKGRTLAADIEIDFIDKYGNATCRRITTQDYQYGPENGNINAFCHLRKGNRSFLFSRIKRAVDLETGTEIQDLRSWLDQRYELTPAAAVESLITQHAAALRCLHYVGKADGAFRANEKAVMRGFIERQSPHADRETIDHVVAEVSTWYPLSAIGFGKEISAVAQSPEAYRYDVLAAAEAIAKTGKASHTAEVNAVKRLRKAVSAPK